MSTDRAVVAAVAAALGGEDEDDAELDLFAAPETLAGRLRSGDGRRGPGRPPGARNKRTERTVRWLLAKYADPRERLLAIGTMNLADLAGLAGCTLQEALVEQRLCLLGVLPYVAQRQPLAIDLTNRNVVYLNVSVPEAAAAGGVGLAARVVEIKEYQEVSEDAPGEVGHGQSDSEG